VNDSAVDPCFHAPPSRRCHSLLIVALGGLLLLAGCAEEALPQRSLSVDDCLTNIELDQLDKAIQRCDKVVAAFPGQPQPLNERFLLHWLKGDETSACRDIRQADSLARRLPPARLDRHLRRDLELRLASCRDTGAAGPQSAKAASAANATPR